ncbi:MAG: hypothetical protein K8L97_17170 [Anaerolineae bacterium]|nr:hypothetical protein [Anaerolineae bacterium]
MSKTVETGIKQIIDTEQTTPIRQIYKTLKELDGTGGAGIANASTTINAILYGEQGV